MPNTTILSSAVNANFTDIATGLSDVLTRDNQAGMLAALRAVSGSLSAPGVTFNSDTTAGMYLPSTGILGLVAHSLGITINTMIYQGLSATVQAGGSGYAVGDTITLTGGTFSTPIVLTVATLSATAVATVTVTVPGIYTVAPSNPVAQGSTSGSGTSATFNVTFNDPGAADYRLGVLDQTSAALWTKLGASSFFAGLTGKANAFDIAKSLFTFGAGTDLSTSTTPPTLTAPSQPYQGGFKNLSIKVASNTTVTVAADAVILYDGTNYRNVAPSSTINLGTNGGVNALDTGTIAAATWYYIWVIAQTASGGTVACLASTSSTSPTMPSGYTYKARIGAVRTAAGSAQLLGTWQFGKRAQYVVGLAQTTQMPNIANGTSGTFSNTAPVYASASVSNVVPTTASEIKVVLVGNWNSASAANAIVAPNSSYAGTSSTNPPLGKVTTLGAVLVDMILESTNIYWAADAAGGGISCSGWTDNL